tara:strand:- start:7111 stop:8046 length:936 start_codon:yes stop_codon:yes gene_type:complete
MSESLIPKIISGDIGSIAKAITIIENGGPLNDEFFKGIYNKNLNTIRIGITGPPGAGKSTLINELIQSFLSNNKSVGVIAVDPTSPFTGGALLGDRVRMNKFVWDERIFIRSMGSRGDRGGMARKAQDAGDVLEASGKDIVIFETVGVGQGEYDVAKAADLTIVVLVPESGDEIQLMKAGLLEIADLFVINKSDREGANQLASILKNILHNYNQKENTIPPVFNTTSSNGIGVPEMYIGIVNLVKKMKNSGLLEKRRLERYKNRVIHIIRERLENEFWTIENTHFLQKAADSLCEIHGSPVEIANKLLKKL